MQSKKFYDKDNMSENVDALMTDMTIGTVNRRQRDAEALSRIREKQAGSREDSTKVGLFERIKAVISWNKAIISRNKEVTVISEKSDNTEYIPSNRNAVRNETPIAFQDDDWDDDTVVMDEFDDDDDATVVMDEEEPVATVRFVNDNKSFRAVITGTRTAIGSQSAKNDIIVDSKRVSRSHAEIIYRDKTLYIKDCGSTNGTYINGSRQRLPKGVEYEINIGDVITLADVDLYIEYANNEVKRY